MRGTPSQKSAIFSFSAPFRDPLRRSLFSLARRPLEKTFRLHQLNSIYDQIISQGEGAKHFADQALESLNITYEVGGLGLASIPVTGPLVIVANHPFGGVDGLILASLLQSVRQDTKIMANYLLSRIPELGNMLLSIDPFGNKESHMRNIAPLRKGMGWLQEGHVLAIFPAGSVSSINLHHRRIVDPQWYTTVARMVRKSQVPVLPMFFEGANSVLFQAAGLVHPGLRTALLPRELLNKRNRRIVIRVGSVLPFKRLDIFDTDEKLVSYLRMRTYELRNRSEVRSGLGKALSSRGAEQAALQIVLPGQQYGISESDVDKLSLEQLLLQTGEYQVFYAAAHQIPNLLAEIGRLREITFRETGEGTGRSTDLDRFDEHYTHMFVWNSKKRHVVGAYRLGLVDRILRRYGKDGLYTSTLFDYRGRFLEHVEYGIELGRSFVIQAYQKL